MRRAFSVALAAFAVVAYTLPAQAVSPAWGSEGICKTVTVAPGQAQLVKVVVTPPTQLDDPSRAGLKGGWKFNLWLTFDSDGVVRPQYRSAIQKRTADVNGHYSFTKRSREQALEGAGQGTESLDVKVFAYDVNGHLQWKSVGAVSTYHYVRDGVEIGSGPDPCRLIIYF